MVVSGYTERSFDWRPRFDERSRDYAVRLLLPPTTDTMAVRRSVQWKPGPILNQGSEGACVGFGWTQEALMSPVRVSIAHMAQRLFVGDGGNSVAHSVFADARREDEWPGEDYEGTSVLAGAKVMTRLGYLREYRWCFDIVDVVQTLVHLGPVVLGINWHRSMYTPDAYGELTVSGDVVGGHCIVASGYNVAKQMHPSSGRPPRPMVQLTNSWGETWGQGGQAWITVEALRQLLEAQGEACVPVHRGYGGKVIKP